MRRTTKIRAAAMAAAAMMLTGAVGWAPTSVGASTPVAPSPFASFTSTGRIELGYSPTGATVKYFPAATGAVPTPPPLFTTALVVDPNCRVTPSSLLAVEPWLTFTTSTGTGISIYENGIGVTPAKNATCNPSTGRIAAGQTLRVGLGNARELSGQTISRARLDIEGKFGAGLRYSTAANTLRDVPLAGSSGDNGADSGASDNTLVTLTSTSPTPAPFTSLTIAPVVTADNKGTISLDNGGDFSDKTANPSIFYLGVAGPTFAYTVPCGGLVTLPLAGNTTDVLNENDSKVNVVEFLRLPNKLPGICENIGVDVQANSVGSADGVFVNNTDTSATGTSQSVRARVKIVWEVETALRPVTGVTVAQELDRDVDFNPLDDPGVTNPVPVAYCTNVPVQVAANPMPLKTQWEDELASTTPTPLAMSLLAPIVHPAGTPWCLLSDTRVMIGTKIIQTQIYSGNGDPRWA